MLSVAPRHRCFRSENHWLARGEEATQAQRRLWLANFRRWGSLNVSDSSSRDSETHSQYTQARALIGAESTPYSSTQATEAESCVPVAATDTLHRAS